MRVSSSYLYGNAASSISERQSQLAGVADQISSGKRILTTTDDPVGAARVIELEHAKSGNDQLMANQINARNSLSQTESLLANIGDVYTDVRTLLMQAGNATMSDSDRASIAQELSSNRVALLSLANSRDADGHYLFGGYAESRPPFVDAGSGVIYQGDEGSRSLQVGSSRTMGLTLPGAGLFNGVRSGNGIFEASVAASNKGQVAAGIGDVENASALDGQSYDIVFHKDAAGTRYDIISKATGEAVSAGNAYTSGMQVSVAGMRVRLAGEPADGDAVSLSPAAPRNVFASIDDAIAALRAPAGNDAQRARLAAGIAAGIGQIDQAAQRSLLARASVGASLKELDALELSSSANDAQLQQRLSQLRDVDYAKAATDLSQSQVALEATQKAYARILGKSVFDFI
jgi:flagellar hook-associated protein 3 FlgL